MKTNSAESRSERDVISPVGLVVVFCMLVITLTVGTFSYRHGLDAGRADAAHDTWNTAYQIGLEYGRAECSAPR